MLKRILKRLLRATYPFQHSFIASRNEFPYLLNTMGLTGVGVEVGVKHATYSRYLLTFWQGKTLYSIDPYIALPAELEPYGKAETQAEHDGFYELARGRLAAFGARSVLLRELSPQVTSKFADESLDFCYIDAMHQYKLVREDIKAWYPKVKRGGIFAGHDYINGEFYGITYGVKTAVDEFCREKGLAPVISHDKGGKLTPSWFIFR